MKRGGGRWHRFSNYKMRHWDLTYKESKIYVSFRVRSAMFPQNRYVEVRWLTTRFRGVKFDFQVHYKVRPDWKAVFKKLRGSLAYGLNQHSREVTDRLLRVEDGKPHPIHNTVRTSRGWK